MEGMTYQAVASAAGAVALTLGGIMIKNIYSVLRAKCDTSVVNALLARMDQREAAAAKAHEVMLQRINDVSDMVAEQNVAMARVETKCSVVESEVNLLRHAKHDNSEALQNLVMKVGELEREIGRLNEKKN